jgi:N6-adenosine-specific RNA methylase IME4
VVKYRTIVADPPWPQEMMSGGAFKVSGRALRRGRALSYSSMSLDDICALAVEPLADEACHLWLWTTNRHLEAAFSVMRAWGFTYMTTITWVKPNGLGAYFASTTQHCLFGYYKRCRFEGRRWAPTHFLASVREHSAKPEAFLDLIETISAPPRLELFARRQRLGWDTWGNEALCHVEMAAQC